MTKNKKKKNKTPTQSVKQHGPPRSSPTRVQRYLDLRAVIDTPKGPGTTINKRGRSQLTATPGSTPAVTPPKKDIPETEEETHQEESEHRGNHVLASLIAEIQNLKAAAIDQSRINEQIAEEREQRERDGNRTQNQENRTQNDSTRVLMGNAQDKARENDRIKYENQLRRDRIKHMIEKTAPHNEPLDTLAFLRLVKQIWGIRDEKNDCCLLLLQTLYNLTHGGGGAADIEQSATKLLGQYESLGKVTTEEFREIIKDNITDATWDEVVAEAQSPKRWITQGETVPAYIKRTLMAQNLCDWCAGQNYISITTFPEKSRTRHVINGMGDNETIAVLNHIRLTNIRPEQVTFKWLQEMVPILLAPDKEAQKAMDTGTHGPLSSSRKAAQALPPPERYQPNADRPPPYHAEPTRGRAECRDFRKGSCPRGDHCHYAHIRDQRTDDRPQNPTNQDGRSQRSGDYSRSYGNRDSNQRQYENRPRSEQCYTFRAKGRCSRGDTCRFTHDTERRSGKGGTERPYTSNNNHNNDSSTSGGDSGRH